MNSTPSFDLENAEIILRRPLGLYARLNTGDEQRVVRVFMPPPTLPEAFVANLLEFLEKQSKQMEDPAFSPGIVAPLAILRHGDNLTTVFPDPGPETLALLMKDGSPLPPEAVLRILEALWGILSALSAKDINRFHLEPDLLYVNRGDLSVRYLDAAMVDLVHCPDIIRFGYLDGRPQFWPPEIISGGEAVGTSNVFFLAMAAHFLLTGRMVDDGLSPVTAAVHSLNRVLPPIGRFDDEQENRMNTFLSRATHKDPRHRVATPLLFLEQLRMILAG